MKRIFNLIRACLEALLLRRITVWVVYEVTDADFTVAFAHHDWDRALAFKQKAYKRSGVEFRILGLTRLLDGWTLIAPRKIR